MLDKVTATPWAVLNLEGQKGFLFNLQLFAEGEGSEGAESVPGTRQGDGTDEGGQGGNVTGKDTGNLELPKTAEELQKLLQAEADRRVTQALKTQEEKYKAELEQKIKEAKEEADTLAKLSNQEKEKYLLEKKEAELKKLQQDIELKQLTIDATNYMTENEINVKFLEYLIPGCKDLDQFAKKADQFKSIFDSAVGEAVEQKLKSSTRPWNSGGGDNGISLGKNMAEFAKKTTTDGETIRNKYFGD